VPAGSELRITYDGNNDEPHAFKVPDDAGAQLDLDVSPPSIGPKIAGIALIAGGGGFVLLGAVAAALGGVSAALSGESDTSTADTIGYVCAGLGVAAMFSGVVVLSSRSLEPRVVGSPHHEVYGRMQTSLGDLASASRRDPTTKTTPTPATPLTFTAAF